jgi:hypothetical protein
VRFEETLRDLLALVGEQVDVAIQSPSGGLIAHFGGALEQGHELAPGATPGPIFFRFTDGATGFVVDQETFAGATRTADGVLRTEDRTGVAIVVERMDDAR